MSIKPCPFCGYSVLDFREGSTFRWLIAECGGCGATCGETRVQTMGDGTKDEWMQQAQADAIEVWNTRAAPQAATRFDDQFHELKSQHTATTIHGSYTAQAAQPVHTDEFTTRGELAARLKCWHRLTREESDELVALLRAQPVALPSEISQEATDAIAAMMKEYGYPCNPANAARAAWRAARLYTGAQPVREQIETLKRARDTAMEQSAKARIPECGHFAAIAQDLDWLVANVYQIDTSQERVQNSAENVHIAQPVREPLSLEQIVAIVEAIDDTGMSHIRVLELLTRAIERAHGIGDV